MVRISLIRNGFLANANHGASDTVQAKNDGFHDFNRKFYLRFDLSSFTGPVQTAVLSMQAAVANADNLVFAMDVFGLKDGHAGENWAENTITWNNAPANNTASFSGMTADAVSLGTMTVPVVPPGTSLSFTSSDLVTFLNQDTNKLVTLMFTTKSTGASPQQFASKEHATLGAPHLTLTQGTAVPEPSSLTLFGAGAIALLAGLSRRRRRQPTAGWRCALRPR